MPLHSAPPPPVDDDANNLPLASGARRGVRRRVGAAAPLGDRRGGWLLFPGDCGDGGRGQQSAAHGCHDRGGKAGQHGSSGSYEQLPELRLRTFVARRGQRV